MTRGLTRDQVISRVYRTRNAHFGSNIYGRVEVPPVSMTKTGDAMFFQFHYTYVDDGEVQHILGWGHPVLIRLLSYSQTALYIDGAFPLCQTPVLPVYRHHGTRPRVQVLRPLPALPHDQQV